MSESPSASDWATSRGEQWKAQLDGMEAMLRPVDEPLIAALNLDAPYRIADIGCGGGGTSLEIARRAPAGSVVHGFDISPALVEVARKRAAGNPAQTAFHVADMAVAAPPGEPYDRLLSRFGIMFFDDQLAAFTNISRWLKPGGQFAFAAWGPAAENPWLSILREVVAQVIEVPPADPAAPSPFRYGDVSVLLELLAQAGFTGLQVNDWRAKIAMGGGMPPEEAATFALAAFSSFRELLDTAGGDAYDTAKALLTKTFSEHAHAGSVQMNACVHLVTGTRKA
jgi:SAM-dependent methyltransferase